VFLFLSRKTIVKQQKQIAQSLEEKETLLREIHHRVKNNLQVISSLLRLQIRVTNDDKVKKALNEGQARIESMSLIHQSLYQKENLASIQMKSYLEKLTKSIFNTYRISNNDVQLHLEIEDFNLSIDTVVPIGLIINELITNSLKYAFASGKSGQIWVTLGKKNDTLFLQVKDSGIGFPKEVLEKEKSKSFGFTLIDAFTKKLDAELSIHNQKGAVVSLMIRNFKSVA
jgi:two-component sensor histidine kinase